MVIVDLTGNALNGAKWIKRIQKRNEDGSC